MHVPLLSNLLGLIGSQNQPQPGGVPDPAFAQMLASVPAPSAPILAVPAPQSPAAPVPAAPVIAPTAQELPHVSKPAAIIGKAVPVSGKSLPELPPATGAPLPVPLPTTLETPATPPDAELPREQTQPLEFADLILLQSWNGAAATLPGVAKRPLAAPAEREMAASAALNLPVVQLVARPAKDRPPVANEPPSPITPESAAPPPIAAVPLTRITHDRAPLALRPADTPLLAPTAPQLADPQTASPEAAPNAPSTEQPAAPEIELGTVIDRLVETRIQSREGRSEVNVPHSDFGRVTLALSLAGQDRLGIAMPDAPAELRAAVGQAFAPPPRSETAPPAPATDSGFTNASDARQQETRRDQQSPGGRGDPSRPNTYAENNHQFTTNRDNRREASGRGVLA